MSRWKKIENTPATIYAIAPADNGAWLLGTNGGIWQVEGEVSTRIAEPLKDVAVTAVAYSRRTMLVGAADGLAFSLDGGDSWTQAGLPKQMAVVQIALTPVFNQAGMAFAVTLEDGFLRTMDLGRSWNTCNFGLVDKEAIAFALSPDFAMDMTAVVAVASGVFRTGNGANAWRQVVLEAEASPMACLAFAKGVVIAGSETHGLYYSANKGETWTKRGTFSSGPISALATSPDAKTVAVATPQVVATTTDLGENWVRTEGKIPKGIIAVAVTDEGAVLCGTQQDGLWMYSS